MYSQPQPKRTDDSFRTFEDLEVYQAAREFRKAMYGVARRLPDFEKFGLVSQVRRAALSLTNNIAEGHGRYHYLDQIKFVLQGRGSLQELMDDLNVCTDENYLSADEIQKLKQEAVRVHQLVNGYIRYLRDRKIGQSLTLQETTSAGSLMDEETDAILAEPIQRFNDSTI